MPALSEPDQRLRAWLEDVVGDVAVSDGVPGDGGDETSVTAYLLGLEPTTTVAGDPHRQAPMVVRLCYLVCAAAPEPRRAVELLDSVLEAALEAPGIDVDLSPVPAQTWIALGARPRPALTVRVSGQHTRAAHHASLVREPLQLDGTAVRSMAGRLLGPGDVALAGSEVTLSATGATTRTSPSGAFAFSTVPVGPGPVRLAVRAKGRAYRVDVDPLDGEPVVVRCDLLEG